MDIFISILILFIFINTALKLSFWQKWEQISMGFLFAIFILLVYPYAIEQSQTQIYNQLQDPNILGNIAVVISIEIGICITFCFFTLLEWYRERQNKWKIILKYYPCLLVFPSLFYLLTQLIFSFIGADFLTIAIYLAIVAGLGIPLLSYFFKIFISEKDLRLEIHFLISLLIAILGLIGTTNGNVVYTVQDENINFKSLMLTFSGFLLFFGLGFLLNKIWWKYFK